MNMSEPAQFSTETLRGEMRHDVPMSRHTSWRAGGQAERMYRPADLADLQVFLRQLPQDEPLLAVGLGSNLLVRDGGVRGTVLLMHGALSELRLEGDCIYVQAGVAGAKLARFAAANNFCGAEFFAGIPGTLGGMLAMNAGCYGSETWQKVRRVQVLTRSGELLERGADEYEVGYRHVALKEKGEGRRGKGGVVAAPEGFTLPPSLFPLPQEEIFVGAWLQFEQGDVEAARQEIKALMEKRSASQPLQMPNAGSVFRNPPGNHAAKLIEGCGLKGKCVGGAQVSEKHANFIVNTGDATAADIENLINEVRATVLQQTGVELHAEVRIVGERIG
jgi:UDP-N-acetylenolpyruvoylglucosamine reductase